MLCSNDCYRGLRGKNLGYPRPLRAGVSSGPSSLDLNTFGNGQPIFQIDTKIVDCAVHFGVAEQELNSSQVANFLVNLSDFSTAYGMCSISSWFQSN